MYLKSITVKNYRKFGTNLTTSRIAHADGVQNQLLNKLSKNTTLFVGKNNSGKTSLLSLISNLFNTKAKSKGKFTIQDINLSYIKNIYNRYVLSNEELNEDKEWVPTFSAEITIGLEDMESNILTAFEEILYIHELETIKDIFSESSESSESEGEDTLGQTEIPFTVVFEPSNIELMKENITMLKEHISQTKFGDFMGGVMGNDKISEEDPTLYDTKIIQTLSDTQNEQETIMIDYCKNYFFNQYLKILSECNYVVNVYSTGSEAPVEKFSFNNLFEVKTINANNVTDVNSLSSAYNKIMTNLIELSDGDFTQKIDNLNFSIESSISDQVGTLNKAVNEIESTQNLKMDLMSDVNIDTILNHAIVYNYVENDYYIPEKQFGLGYTNLMMIIAELTDFFINYKQEHSDSKVNLIIIEEPESFMHPQMQELFINHIEKAINVLSDNSNISGFKYQLLISTHSSHILNNKIHTGNTFDNINYLTNDVDNNAILKCLSDESIKNNEDQNTLEFVKKHIQLETSDIFFSDAVVLVEGTTEEVLIKYLISQEDILSKHHITVYRIDGAHVQVYMNLLKELQIPVVIYTDMDYVRKNHSKKDPIEPSDYKSFALKELTSETLKESTVSSNTIITDLFINTVEEEEHIRLDKFKTYLDGQINNEFFEYNKDNITIFTQGKVNGFYATSFEEAFILQNIDNSITNKKALDVTEESINTYNDLILGKTFPQIYSNAKRYTESNHLELAAVSYYLQSKFSSSNKTKFANEVLRNSIVYEDKFEINYPAYIREGLEWLASNLKE